MCVCVCVCVCACVCVCVYVAKPVAVELRCHATARINKGYAYAMVVHILADQILPQLLIEQFHTLPS